MIFSPFLDNFPYSFFVSLLRFSILQILLIIAPGRYIIFNFVYICFSESVYVSRIYDFFLFCLCTHACPGSSPQVYTGLSPGEHRLKVVPSIDECGRRRRPQVIKFTV